MRRYTTKKSIMYKIKSTSYLEASRQSWTWPQDGAEETLE